MESPEGSCVHVTSWRCSSFCGVLSYSNSYKPGPWLHSFEQHLLSLPIVPGPHQHGRALSASPVACGSCIQVTGCGHFCLICKKPIKAMLWLAISVVLPRSNAKSSSDKRIPQCVHFTKFHLGRGAGSAGERTVQWGREISVFSGSHPLGSYSNLQGPRNPYSNWGDSNLQPGLKGLLGGQIITGEAFTIAPRQSHPWTLVDVHKGGSFSFTFSTFSKWAKLVVLR